MGTSGAGGLPGRPGLAGRHHKQGDRARAGIYGGSYGGFMTYMALVRSPGTLQGRRCAAAGGATGCSTTTSTPPTSSIRPSSTRRPTQDLLRPIHYADGLQDHLLIAHGMIDDNVFFKDSVDMTQKLIELHKDNWQVAPLPLERHGFTRADAWLDEYKRILKLFNEHVKPQR
ncbi:alpha/beta hydrolase family protein [Xanthomonas dyei]|uniref:alpha/beta hydrolase family protein n=1 Tax=Xanthomonas dyei TaxID=743699 RepID=UPI00360A60AF